MGTQTHCLWYLDIGGRSFWSCGVGGGASVPSYLMSAQVDWDSRNLEARSLL